jgi:uncharacterized membrane protein YbhN (UPF0104 family)
VLHVASGDVPIGTAECAALRCEPGVISTLGGARFGALALLLVVYAGGTLAWAARWRALLALADVDATLAKVWRVSVEAQAGGILLPGGVGGDAFRIASVAAMPARHGGARPPLLRIIASVLLDRAIGLSLIAAVAGALGIAFARGSLGRGAGALVAVLVAIPAGVVAVLVALRAAPAPALAKFFESSRATRALAPHLAPVLSYVRDPRAPRCIAEAAAWSLVVALTQIGVVRGLVYAVGATPTTETWVYVGAAMAFIVGAVPALPGAWGTADAAYVFFFTAAGLAPSVGLSVCLLFRLFWYVCGVVGGVLVATRRDGPPEEAPAPAAPVK